MKKEWVKPEIKFITDPDIILSKGTTFHTKIGH